MVELVDVSLVIAGREVIRSFSAVLEAGGIIGLIGPSGSGKSALLRIMAGMIRDFSGEVLIRKRPMRSLGRRELARAVSPCIGAAPHNMDETLEGFLMLSRNPWKRFFHPYTDFDLQTVEQYRGALGLDAYRGETLASLPSGALKRALLAGAMAREAPLLLLDDPTAHLDLHAQALLQRALSRYTIGGGRSVLLASGDINFIAQTADRVLVMDAGILAEDIAPERIDVELIRRYFKIEVLVSRNIYNGRPELHVFPRA